jgi:hypothetical protein
MTKEESAVRYYLCNAVYVRKSQSSSPLVLFFLSYGIIIFIWIWNNFLLQESYNVLITEESRKARGKYCHALPLHHIPDELDVM